MEWLEVTNFAINCRFLEVARTAVNSGDLEARLSNDHFWGLATLYDDTRPALVRPGSVSEEVYRNIIGKSSTARCQRWIQACTSLGTFSYFRKHALILKRRAFRLGTSTFLNV